ncbi:hypothetical protein B566_EDAN015823, partial [Ephemera danica]
MSWWFEWPPLLLLLVVVTAGAELLLLKHEEVYWFPPPPTTYSGLNCKPHNQFGEPQKCGDWNIGSWKIVKSFIKDLPPVFDFRWNDMKRHDILKESSKLILQHPAINHLYLPMSLLVQSNALDGTILNNGTRWTTVTLKYEARRYGDYITLYNHETGIENTWHTNLFLNGVNNVYFTINQYTTASFGLWRLHSYDILEPTNTSAMVFYFTATATDRLCVSVTYNAQNQNNVANLRFYSYKEKKITTEKILSSTGNEWKTVRYVFPVNAEWQYALGIFPPNPNFQSFSVAEVRTCSEREYRVSKIVSGSVSGCSELKNNATVALKSTNTNKYASDADPGLLSWESKVRCENIIPNVRNCSGVLICSIHACSCAPGYQGPNCDDG